MPGHEGAVPGSRYHRWRVPWVGRTRAVAPCLLCEVLAASVLVPGPWAGLPRLSPSIHLLPLGRFDWWFLGSVSTSWESLAPYSVVFDSFSSSSSLHLSARALLEVRVGVLVWVFIHQPPCLLILQHGSQVGHTGSPSLLSYNLLFILQVSILSEQMVFCVS